MGLWVVCERLTVEKPQVTMLDHRQPKQSSGVQAECQGGMGCRQSIRVGYRPGVRSGWAHRRLQESIAGDLKRRPGSVAWGVASAEKPAAMAM